MKKEKKHFILSISLMVVSGILLFTAILYYDFSGKIKNYRYSDREEYENITEGLDYLAKLPIHFNIINQYFSDINNLSDEIKEEIIMAYVIKNQYNLYECGPSNETEKYLCIDKETLNSKDLLSKFNMKLTFKSEKIDIYVDDYGTYQVTTGEKDKSYKILLDNSNNKLYRVYSRFERYKEEKDKYIFYLYQGYYNGNCTQGEDLILYDFMTGKKVYQGTCNGNQEFSVDPDNHIKKLQLYKYELKKDKNNRFYLYGYNPVNNIE